MSRRISIPIPPIIPPAVYGGMGGSLPTPMMSSMPAGYGSPYDTYRDHNRSSSSAPMFQDYTRSPGVGHSQFPRSSYQIYNTPVTGSFHHLPGYPSYDDLGIRDGYYDDSYSRRSHHRQRRSSHSMTPRSRHSSLTPRSRHSSLTPRSRHSSIPPPTPRNQSQHISSGTPRTRHRRNSTVSFVTTHLPPSAPGASADPYYQSSSGKTITFRRKGSLTPGLTLTEAKVNVRLSSGDSYTLRDLHADPSNEAILLRVKWTGYAPLTYQVPLDTYKYVPGYEVDGGVTVERGGGEKGRVCMQTLARRVSRAVGHYIEHNMIPISFDRVELRYLEELSYGHWNTVLGAI